MNDTCNYDEMITTALDRIHKRIVADRIYVAIKLYVMRSDFVVHDQNSPWCDGDIDIIARALRDYLVLSGGDSVRIVVNLLQSHSEVEKNILAHNLVGVLADDLSLSSRQLREIRLLRFSASVIAPPATPEWLQVANEIEGRIIVMAILQKHASNEGVSTLRPKYIFDEIEDVYYAMRLLGGSVERPVITDSVLEILAIADRSSDVE